MMGAAWSDPWTPIGKEMAAEKAGAIEQPAHRSNVIPGEMHLGPADGCRYCRRDEGDGAP